MKHLNLWESYQDNNRVARICKQYGIQNWSLNSQGLVDVRGDVNLSGRKLTKLPLYFGEVNDFFCTDNKLTTLEGAPRRVNGRFGCSGNRLKNLVGSPEIVIEHFRCLSNQLTTLQGITQQIGESLNCEGNLLTSLEGAPEIIDGFLNCVNNPLSTLEGAPRIIRGDFIVDFTKLTTLEIFPQVIENITSDDWIIERVEFPHGRLGHFPDGKRQTEAMVKLFHTLPSHTLTPKMILYIKENFPRQFNILKNSRAKDQRWKTDLGADLGELGF